VLKIEIDVVKLCLLLFRLVVVEENICRDRRSVRYIQAQMSECTRY
jgi:hypothetical protein